MKRNSFLFYSDWKQAIENMPNDMRLMIYENVIDYATTGKQSELEDPEARIAFRFMKTSIDKDIQKYMLTVERNRTNGSKHTPKKQQTVATPKTQKDPLGDDNDIDNDIDRIIKKETTGVVKKETEVSSQTRDYEKFLSWLTEQAPFCANTKNFPKQITGAEFDRLKAKYTGKQIAYIIEQLENRKDLRKRYTNLYRTVLNWAKREYGKE